MSVCKNVLKNFQMSEQYWGCSDKMSEANFSPAETLNAATRYNWQVLKGSQLLWQDTIGRLWKRQSTIYRLWKGE